jgi:hypothetical protein
MNILATFFEDDFLKANQLNIRPEKEFESPWTNILLKSIGIKEQFNFKKNLMKDNNRRLNVKSFTESEFFMFSILNYCLDNKKVHENLNKKFISNVIINILNPFKYDWAKNYVRYVMSKRDSIKNIQALNNNIIFLITDNFLFEWSFSKIICKDYTTVYILEEFFKEETVKQNSPKLYIDHVFNLLSKKKIRLNLFVVYLEILQYLKCLPKTSVYYYELCGISSYFFGLLSMFTKYRAYRVTNTLLPNNAIYLMANMNESMITLYYVVRLVLNSHGTAGNYISYEINDLIFQCLLKAGACSIATAKKAFGCINMMRINQEKYESTELSKEFFNYIRTYIFPIAINGEKYINDLHTMLTTVKIAPQTDSYDLFYDMKDFYELTMFLSTK